MPAPALAPSAPQNMEHPQDGLAAALDPDTELALLRQVGAGDTVALARLYAGYRRRLYRFLGRLSRRQEVIDEAINDTFLVIWQKASGFRGDSRVSTWIMGIAYRCGLKVLRQQGDTPVEPENGEPPGIVDPGVDHELRDWLAKGMEHLPAEQRLALELAYGGGHSIEEIATIMECPQGTVKARMFHARMKLRNLLPALAGPADAPEQGAGR